MIIKETCYKGTRIILGNEKRELVDCFLTQLKIHGFIEINIPIIQLEETFVNKVGEENSKMMYCFQDPKPRNLCLAPEYTAVIQKLSNTIFKQQKDVKVFYVAECFRGEKPQAGRYRQFTQLGVEIINPTKDYKKFLLNLATSLLDSVSIPYNVNTEAIRGLEYYKNGKGFEISCDKLGTSKQIVGGGEYEGGIGFAIGIDRLI